MGQSFLCLCSNVLDPMWLGSCVIAERTNMAAAHSSSSSSSSQRFSILALFQQIFLHRSTVPHHPPAAAKENQFSERRYHIHPATNQARIVAAVRAFVCTIMGSGLIGPVCTLFVCLASHCDVCVVLYVCLPILGVVVVV